MAKYLLRVMRALIVTCLGAGGGVGLLVFIVILLNHGGSGSFQFAFTFGLSVGVAMAVLLAFTFLLIDLTSRLFLARGVTEDIWKIEQIREITAEGTAKEVVSACRQALLAVPHVKAVSDDMEHLITRASIGQSWRSSGETMEVEINPQGDLNWKLQCTSRPQAKDTVFDYGKNFENVETWQREIKVAFANAKNPSPYRG